MLKSKRYPYLNCIDSQALLAQCEKKGQKDSLSVLTQYLHNRKYMTADGKKQAFSFISEEVLDKKEGNESVLNDDPLELYFKEFFDVPFPEPEKPKFTFIDLFAGIGGFRMALQNLGGKCVFSSEWDSQAQRTYFANYGEYPFGDITLESTKQYIPDNFELIAYDEENPYVELRSPNGAQIFFIEMDEDVYAMSGTEGASYRSQFHQSFTK